MNRALVQQYIEKHANKGVFELDLSNPQDMTFYMSQAETAGMDTQMLAISASIMQAALKVAKMAGTTLGNFGKSGSVFPVHGITNFTTADGIKYGASAITSLPSVAVNVTQTLGIFDENAVPLSPIKFNKHYNTGANCQIDNVGTYSNTRSLNKAVTTIYTFSQTIGPTTMFAAEIVRTFSYPNHIQDGNPKDINKNGIIKICLTRNSPDCDYWHDYGGTVSIPVKGSILYYDNIDVDGQGKPLNAHSNIYIIRQRQGGSPINPQDGNIFFQSPNTTVSGATINWNLDWLKLNKVDFTSGEMVYYVFSLTVQTKGKAVVSYITNAPSSIVDPMPLNVQRIKPMQIVYGCLGENTMITMEDGSQKPIQNIDAGEWVRSRYGKKLRVEHSTTGTEDDYLNIFYGEEGQSIVSSTGHPFVTTQGIVLAKELEAGIELVGPEEKLHTIREVTTHQDEINVYNLHLSTNFPAEELEEDESIMYANGVLVGDTVMQEIHEEKFHQREVNILDALPDEWKEDFKRFQQQQNRTD